MRTYLKKYLVMFAFCMAAFLGVFLCSADMIPAAVPAVYDEAGLLDNDRDLLRGMEVFYDKTGIQPYLYISEISANGLSDAEAERISNEIYEQLFNDEGHLLICYFPNENEGQDDFPYMIKTYDIEGHSIGFVMMTLNSSSY